MNRAAEETTYTYDALGRRAARSAAAATRGAHYGDLTDVPILDTDSEGKVTTSYVRGPQGLVEQRSEGATSFPLPDAHGDVTAIANAAGEVASRQEYDPWGVQLSGPELEMGYLGAQQRRTDPATGLIQMGARPYSPALASFIAEDPVLGHFGIGISLDRYAYVWDNPLLYFDLNGRSILDDAAGAMGDAWNATGGKAWDATAGARTAVGVAGDGDGGAVGNAVEDSVDYLDYVGEFWSDRARAFWKAYGDTVTDVASFVAANAKDCQQGAQAGAASGAIAGSILGPKGTAAGSAAGAVLGCAAMVGANETLRRTSD